MGRGDAIRALTIAGSCAVVADAFAVVQLAGSLDGPAEQAVVGALAVGAGISTATGTTFGMVVSHTAVETTETRPQMATADVLAGVGVALGIVSLGLGIADLATIDSESGGDGAGTSALLALPTPWVSEEGAGAWAGGLSFAGMW